MLLTLFQWQQDSRAALAVGAPNGSASPLVKPLVDYPDDDDEDAMDTKPEDLPGESPQAQPLNVADAQAETSPETGAPASPTVQTPPQPERLAEKRRREEEDEDELVKLAAGPKRRSSTSSNSGAGILNRKKTLSIGSIGSEKGGTTGVLGSVTSSAPPKRIAINLSHTKSSNPGNDSVHAGDTSNENSEKENRDDSQGD